MTVTTPRHHYRQEQLVSRNESQCLASNAPDCLAGTWCAHSWYWHLLYTGEAWFDRHGNAAMRGAWRKGKAAFDAGVAYYDNPYEGSSRRDRRGRYQEGFRAAFRRCWDAGWAWGEFTDPDEETMRALLAIGERWGTFVPTTPWNAEGWR